jgi:hypothetical protein
VDEAHRNRKRYVRLVDARGGEVTRPSLTEVVENFDVP